MFQFRYYRWVFDSVVLSLINFLFCYKYFTRLTSHGLAASIFYTILLQIIVIYIATLPSKFFTKRVFGFALVLIVLLSVSVMYIVPVEKLRVDRWFVITNFWNDVFAGVHPYPPVDQSVTHAAFPIYFLINLIFTCKRLIFYLIKTIF